MTATARRDSKYSDLDRACQSWARWVNTDRFFGELAYPRSCITPSIYESGEDTAWRKRQKNTRTTNTRLPDWRTEMVMDEIIQSLNIEFRRVIYCRYEARVNLDQMHEMRISGDRMPLYGGDGRCAWPRYRHQRIAALRMPERTFDRTLQWAREQIIDNPRFWEAA